MEVLGRAPKVQVHGKDTSPEPEVPGRGPGWRVQIKLQSPSDAAVAVSAPWVIIGTDRLGNESSCR